MAYKFTTVSRSDVQKENAYILYMIVGSYFNKCICLNKITECNLYLYYREMPVGKQLAREKQVIERTEKAIGFMADDLKDLHCQVEIRRDAEEIRLVFRTWFHTILVTVEPKGRYSFKAVPPL